MLPTMKNKANDEKLADRLQQHLAETKRHVENIEQVFAVLGEQPKPIRCPASRG
jgi:ferritin-like metal-binding protein YciE